MTCGETRGAKQFYPRRGVIGYVAKAAAGIMGEIGPGDPRGPGVQFEEPADCAGGTVGLEAGSGQTAQPLAGGPGRFPPRAGAASHGGGGVVGAGASVAARESVLASQRGPAPGVASGGRFGHSPALVIARSNRPEPRLGPGGEWIERAGGATVSMSLALGLTEASPSKDSGEYARGAASGLWGAARSCKR